MYIYIYTYIYNASCNDYAPCILLLSRPPTTAYSCNTPANRFRTRSLSQRRHPSASAGYARLAAKTSGTSHLAAETCTVPADLGESRVSAVCGGMQAKFQPWVQTHVSSQPARAVLRHCVQTVALLRALPEFASSPASPEAASASSAGEKPTVS